MRHFAQIKRPTRIISLPTTAAIIALFASAGCGAPLAEPASTQSVPTAQPPPSATEQHPLSADPDNSFGMRFIQGTDASYFQNESTSGNTNEIYLAQPWVPAPSDILWQNTQTTEVSIWQMTRSGTIGAYAYPQASVPAAWVVRGTGDFNGDGIGDILWQNTQTTEVGIWLMNSSGTIGAYLYPQSSVPAAWVVCGTGDFNGDGTTDILWQNTQTSEMSIWQMNNGAIGAYLYLQSSAPAAWVVRGTGDFNGDGTTDILWQNTQTTEVGIWQMNNGAVGAYLYPQTSVPSQWVVNGVLSNTGDLIIQ